MKQSKIFDIVIWFVLIIISLAIGGTFVDGNYLGTTILKMFPEIVHTLVGWVIIVSTIIGAVLKLSK